MGSVITSHPCEQFMSACEHPAENWGDLQVLALVHEDILDVLWILNPLLKFV